jgi:IK cytokine
MFGGTRGQHKIQFFDSGFQESKFLGGDMEHTHLVKGLDFALLQKVRSEIATRENDEEFEDEPESKEIKA